MVAEAPPTELIKPDRVTVLEAELVRLESQLMREAWGDYVDTREFLWDDPSFGFGSYSRAVTFTSLDDRRDGSFRPIYDCEQDLASLRAAARNLVLLTGIRTGILDTLANSIFSHGFTFKAEPENDLDQAAALLAKEVQKAIDRFTDENDFAGVIDREIHLRSREDGECLVTFDEDEIREGRLLLEFIEPDQLTEPLNAQQLEDWLGTEFPSSWKYGVHTPEHKTWKPLGYHIVRDDRGNDWAYLEPNRVEHIKRNVTRNAKRGVSDFLEPLEDLKREAKLAGNMQSGAALQAAIAWILQGIPGTSFTQGQMQTVGGDDRMNYKKPSVFGPQGTTTTQSAAHYGPGSILKPAAGLEYKAGPMGAERNDGFEVVGQYALRRIGVRWGMPEYMVSGDASNNNRASSETAEAQFIKAREADQQFYKRHFLSLMWKVVRIHVESGRFERFGIGREQYDDLMRVIRIDAECPEVATRDLTALGDYTEKMMNLGLMSPPTASGKNRLDFDREQKLGAKKAPPPVQMGPDGLPLPGQPKQPPVPGQEPEQPQEPANDTRKAAVTAALESVETTEEAREILGQLESYP